MLLDNVLALTIPSNAIRDMNPADLNNLLATYEIAESAKEDFLAGELTLDEYFQLLEMAQVNIDGYMKTLETNLETLKVI